MSILDKLAKKGLEKTQAKAPEWIDSAINRAKNMIPEDADPALREAVSKSLEAIRSQKAALAQLTEEGLASVLALVGLGQSDKAALLFLRGQAEWEKLRQAQISAADRAVKAKQSREQLIDMLEKIGQEAAARALPFLLAAI